MSAHKIIFLNQKGGVGKTTTAVNIGSILAEYGNKVLLVDLDSQCNMTSSVSADSSLPGSYQLLEGLTPAKKLVQNTSVENLYCIAGDLNLAGVSIELAQDESRNLYLKKNLSVLENDYDYILVDCPPELGVLSMNALAWTKYVFIPMQCEYFSLEGVNLLVRTISNVKRVLNPEIQILGIGFTMYSKRAKLHNEVVEDISSFFNSLVFDTKIPRNIRLSEAPSHGLPINVYDNSSVGGKAYRELTKEVMSRVR